MSSQILPQSGHLFLNRLSETFQQPKVQNGLALIGLAYTTKFLLEKLSVIGNTLRVFILPRIFGSKINWRQLGEWAVITGSTDGIGKEFARQLASHGLNIVLISRNPEKLRKVADEITREYSVQVKTITVNFSEATPDKTYKKIEEELRNLNVGVLINNVGVFIEYPMPLGQMAEGNLWDHVVVNCGAATMMTRVVLPQMKERKRGAIINISSGAALRPIPHIATYSASKIYMDYLSEGVRKEYKEDGIIIQNLNPFYIATNMTAWNKQISTPGVFIPTAEQYATSALKTFGLVDKTTGYLPHTIQQGIFYLIPKWLGELMQDKHQKILKREAEEKARKKLKLK